MDGGTVYSEDMKRYWDRSQGFLGTLFFLVFKNKFIYLFIFWLRWVFIAVHGLFSNRDERGLLFIVVASLVAEHRL